MAVTDAQIRAVLSANPNASDARILKALANYGVSPERFTAVTGRTLGATPTTTPATPAPAPVAQSYQMPSFGNITDAEMYAAMAGQQYQAPAPIVRAPTPAPAPVVSTPAPVVQSATGPGLQGYQLKSSPTTLDRGITGAVPAPTAKTPPTATASGIPSNRMEGLGILAQAGEIPAPSSSAEREGLLKSLQEQRSALANMSQSQLQQYTPMKRIMGPMEAAPIQSSALAAKTPRTATASGIPYSKIKTALAANPNATPDQIAKAMINYGATPDDMRRVLGQSFEGNTAIRQAYGQAGGFTDQQIRDAVMGRAGEQGGFATQEQIQKAAQNYGISPEQLARVFPQVQPGSMNQAPIVTEQTGLMPAISAIGRAADITAGTSTQGQQDLLGRLNQVGQVTGGLYDEAQGYQQAYRELGQQAAQRQAALTGALGPEAQAQAFAEYQASPELAFRQQRGEEALMRQAAALGGLGGGNVRKALAQFTSDLYSQDLSNRLAQLGDIATRGYGAGATSAQLGGQEAQVMSGLGEAGALTAAQMQDALSGRLGNILLNEAAYRNQAGRDISQNIGAATATIGGLQVGAGDAYRGQLGQLTDQQLQIYNDIAAKYGQTFADQYMARANAYMTTGGALQGVQISPMQAPEGYNIGNTLENTAFAYRMGGQLFNNQQQQNPSGYQFGGQPIPSGGNTGGGINYNTMYGF